jgi:preprotein translocase subunit YajC
MDFVSYAYAMGTTGGTGTTTSSGAGWINLVFIGSIFFIFYFILIRPQQKMRKQHNEMLTALKTGDKIVTTGGIYGEITGIDTKAVTIEIAPKVRIKITRESVSTVVK